MKKIKVVIVSSFLLLIVFFLFGNYGFSTKSEEFIVTQPNEVPVGTIIASVLQYDDFMKLNAQVVNPFNGKKSIWAPCDGRDISGSKYAAASSLTPDLRGVFLRCVNSIYEDGNSPPIISDHKNLGDQKAGEYQGDVVGLHKHQIPITTAVGLGTTGNSLEMQNKTTGDMTTQDFGSEETRPKNISVFYYIKIN